MPTVDELLNNTIESQVCTIDPDTRVINVPACYKEFGVEADEKVNRIKFQCPKIVGDNIDLTTFNLYINYMNARGNYNVYLVDDVTVSGDNITFSWLLSRHVTEKSGTVNYIVCAKKSDDTSVINEWNTKVATATVGVGLEATAVVEEQNADVIEQILKTINAIGSGGSETWELVAEITTTENVNSMRATFDACSAVYIELRWGGVEDNLGDIAVYPNTGDTPYSPEQRAAAAMVTSSTAKKRGVLCVRMDCRVGSYWYATSWQKARSDGSFGAIDASKIGNLDIGLNGSAQYSVVSDYYMTTGNDTPASGVKSITAYGAGMAIGTTLKVWGIKK